MEIEPIHVEGNDPRWNMPYTPAIKVRGGSLVFVSGVTAAPVYHSHPHDPAEFEQIPDDPALQAEMTMQNLGAVLTASGADFAATLMSGGFETRAADRGFALLDSVHDIYDPYLGVWAAARDQWLEEQSDLATDFVSAYREASEWVFDPLNRQECIELLQRLPNTSPELAERLYEIQVTPGVGNIEGGALDPAGIRNVLNLRDEFGGFEEPQDIDELVGPGTELFDLRFIEASRDGDPS